MYERHAGVLEAGQPSSSQHAPAAPSTVARQPHPQPGAPLPRHGSALHNTPLHHALRILTFLPAGSWRSFGRGQWPGRPPPAALCPGGPRMRETLQTKGNWPPAGELAGQGSNAAGPWAAQQPSSPGRNATACGEGNAFAQGAGRARHKLCASPPTRAHQANGHGGRDAGLDVSLLQSGGRHRGRQAWRDRLDRPSVCRTSTCGCGRITLPVLHLHCNRRAGALRAAPGAAGSSQPQRQ